MVIPGRRGLALRRPGLYGRDFVLLTVNPFLEGREFVRQSITFAFLLSILGLSACTTVGPGSACDPCATAETGPANEATGPLAQAASASARGGQEASNQPIQMDPGARDIHTPISRGAGNQTVTDTSEEKRSQAGAPSVNQGVVLPTAADARTGGGVSPVVASLQPLVDDLRAALKLALMDPTAPQSKIDSIHRALNDAISQMAQAQASAQGQVNNTYHLEGAVITQTVANGSASGDGQQAVDPSNAKALADGLPLTVEAAAKARAASGTPDAPETAPVPVPAPAPAPVVPGGGN